MATSSSSTRRPGHAEELDRLEKKLGAQYPREDLPYADAAIPLDKILDVGAFDLSGRRRCRPI